MPVILTSHVGAIARACVGSPRSTNQLSPFGVQTNFVPPNGTPETGAQCSNTTDDDHDGVVNDGCPQMGSFSEAQFHIGTSPLAPCGAGWPSNLWDQGLSANKLDIQDLTNFIAPVRRIGTNPGDANFSSRYDLVPGKGILSSWINLSVSMP